MKPKMNSAVLWVASELHSLVSDISLEDPIEKYHRAQDDIKNLKSNLKIRGGPSTLESATDTATTTDNRVDASVPPEEKRNDFDSKSDHEGHDSFGDDECENERFRDESSAWNYTVEKLIFVSSFNVTLTRSCCFSNGQESTCPFPEKEHIHLKVHHDKSKKRGRIRVIVQNTQGGESSTLVASIIFPEIILSPEEEVLSTLWIEDNIIMFRLKYYQDGALLYAENEVSELSLKTSVLTSVKALNNITCRFCLQSSPNQQLDVIKKSLHLPVGFWDEVVDYITCYEGVRIEMFGLSIDCSI